MSDSTLSLVKNGLIPAVVQMMSACFVNNGCNCMKFMKFHEGVSSHVFSHMVVIHLWMLGLQSEGGVRQDCMLVRRALLPALSARSLPGMPTCPGSQ